MKIILMDNNVQKSTREAEIIYHFRNADDELTTHTEVLVAVIEISWCMVEMWRMKLLSFTWLLKF